MTSALTHIDIARKFSSSPPLVRTALMVAGVTLLSVTASQILPLEEPVFSRDWPKPVLSSATSI